MATTPQRPSASRAILVLLLPSALAGSGCAPAASLPAEGTADQAESTTAPAEKAAKPRSAVDASAPLDASPSPEVTPLVDVAEPAPSFERVFKEVLAPGSCTNGYCHGYSAPLSMMTAKAAYAALVGVRAAGVDCAGTVRVVPGRPEESLLWQKVAPGVVVCGKKMPAGREPLAGPQLELVRRWIAAGALP